MITRDDSTVNRHPLSVSACWGRSSPGGPGVWAARQSCACRRTHPDHREPARSAPLSTTATDAPCSPCSLVPGCVTACSPQLSWRLFGISARWPQTHGPCGSPSRWGTLAGCERQPRPRSCAPGRGDSCLPLQVGPGSEGAMGTLDERGNAVPAGWKGFLAALSEDKPVHGLWMSPAPCCHKDLGGDATGCPGPGLTRCLNRE